LASTFRRYNICEERGSGFEKAITAIELFGLPPLKFEETESSFKVIKYAPRPFTEITDFERIEACYQHSIIQYFGTDGMTNASLRLRFGMHDKQASQISRLIKQAIDKRRIKYKDPNNVSTKFNVYLPYWA
jgi:predicted HTH transcriptional regulator